MQESMTEFRQTCLDDALRYASYGWPVFPCHSARSGVCSCRLRADCRHPAKHPHTRHGLKDATIDLRQIKKWWGKWPDANVAIVTGADSDLLVIDVDQAHGGPDSLEALLKRLDRLPDHPIAQTGGGGTHRVFQHPGCRVPSRQAVAEGIDIRADGAYIIAPPSRHASGNAYEWHIDPETVTPPTLPESWLDWLSSCGHRDTEAQDIVGAPRSGEWDVVACDGVPLDEWVTRAIIATMPAAFGQRHDCLFKFARWLGEDLPPSVSHLRPIFTSSRDFDCETAVWDLPAWSYGCRRLGNVLHQQSKSFWRSKRAFCRSGNPAHAAFRR